MCEQQLVARIKRSSKYWGQTAPNQWFNVRAVEDRHYQLRGNNNNYRLCDVVCGLRLASGTIIDFATGKMIQGKIEDDGGTIIDFATGKMIQGKIEDDGGDPTTATLLKPSGNHGIVDTEVCFSALLLVGTVDLGEGDVDGWTDEQKAIAYDWAVRVHLRASDNDDVYLPPRPDFIRSRLRAPQIVPGGNQP